MVKMNEPDASSVEAKEANVSIQFTNLPPDSRAKLDTVLRGWADWHAAKYLPGYVPPEVVSGSLSYHPGTMHLAWEDKPALPDVPPSNTMWFNVKYEQAGGVPRYDRYTDSQLHYSAKKRPSDTLLAAEEAANATGAAGRPVKRLRGNNRCFNCGSYGHSMRECWKERNRELVEESKREHAEAREASGAGYRSAAKRYYLEGAAEGGGRGANGRAGLEQVPGEFDGLEPGQLSAELRQALGIGPLAPPPWLQRMREMGLPPGYMEEVPLSPEAGATGAAATHSGREDGAAGKPPESAAQIKADAEAGDVPLGDFIALEGSPEPESGAEGAAAATPVRLECRVQFPGVNAPAPDGGDEAAWAPPQSLLPPGFGSPRLAAPGAAAAAGGGQGTPASVEREDPWQQRQPSAGERPSGSGSGSDRDARWRPLRGLHPPRHSPSEGPVPMERAQYPPSRQPQFQHQQPEPPRDSGYRSGTPDLYPPPQPQAQSWHDRQPLAQQAQQAGVYSQASGQQLPPGLGQLPSQQGQQQYQEYHVHQNGVSQSDPGHLLAYGQPSAAASQQYQQPLAVQQLAWPAAQQQADPQYQQQQQYSHQDFRPYDSQHQREQPGQQPYTGVQLQGSSSWAQQQQQQQPQPQLWTSNGRY